jgi:hypothetical protein
MRVLTMDRGEGEVEEKKSCRVLKEKVLTWMEK